MPGIDLTLKAIERAPATRPEKEVVLALDPASTEFFKDGAYSL